MKRVVRGAVAGLVSLAVLAGAAASASALTVSPTGGNQLSAGPVTLTVAGTGQSLRCRTVAFDLDLARDGTGTSGATFTDCRHATFGDFGIVSGEWSVKVTLRSLRTGELNIGTLIGFELTSPRGGIVVGNGICVFSVGGTVVLGHQYRETTLPITASTTDEWAVLSSTLAIIEQRGCGFTVGTRVTHDGPYTLGRGLVIDG